MTPEEKARKVHEELDRIEAARRKRHAELEAMSPEELAVVANAQADKPVGEWEVCPCCHTPLVRFMCPLGCI